ncbi:DNA cytosine methyltransferase [Lacticaseibacillus parakribbianus]|uniref:DNA cytosine methyltransferase n=1 Tax=Lacticaseibacillus parakribbianus TaxID=2970927 RepID=UPI0021CB73B1|nr:DNA cytosine methyltransferase [Lacticaseibacillus parakribbianus]
MKAVSIFSGAGGLDLGFQQAGVEIMAAYDNMAPMVQTYRQNVGVAHQVDLASCDFNRMRDELALAGDLDLVIGGPPCQGFTSAGAKFWADPRNALIRNYAEALRILHPRWFVMENVEGLLTAAKGRYLEETLKAMIALGYSLAVKKVYMQEYGIPQRRKRVIIVGNREGKRYAFPQPIEPASGAIYRNGASTLRDAIGDLENVVDAAIDQVPVAPTALQAARIRALLPGQSMKDLPLTLQHDSFSRRAHRRVQDGTASARRGGAPSGLKRLQYDEPALTITSAASREFVHPVLDRTLTLRECARIQTFPDSFRFCGTKSQRLLQIGNAVPPRFAALLAASILQADQTAAAVVPQGLVAAQLTKSTGVSPALQRTLALLQPLTVQQLNLDI